MTYHVRDGFIRQVLSEADQVPLQGRPIVELTRLAAGAIAASGSDEAIVRAAGPASGYRAEHFMAALGVDQSVADGIVASLHAQTALEGSGQS